MEHILQFGISIDDDAIRKQIEKSATQTLVTDLKKDVKGKMFNGWGDMTPRLENIVRDVLNDYKEEIIKQSVEQVVDSIKRSKKYREALVDVASQVLDAVDDGK